MQPDNTMQTLVCVVEHITFRNEANGYTVMDVHDEENEFTAVGAVPRLGEGESVELTGSWTVHPEYGLQFRIQSAKVLAPRTSEQLERFLASGLIRGCGPATASAIIAKFGEDAADVLQFAPHRLCEVPGIGPKTAQKIGASYLENLEMREVVSGLSAYGVTVGQAIRIAKEYGADGVAMVKENPYRLAEDIFGIGFKTADAIAQSMGIAKDAPFRLGAGLRYALQLAGGEGHTFLPAKLLCTFTAKQLAAPQELVERRAAQMVQTGELMLGEGEDEPVYLRTFFYAERECAMRLHALCTHAPAPLRADRDAAVERHQKESGIVLAGQQRQAVLAAVDGPVCVITGGPGTGKTTIVQFLLSVFDQAGVEVALCAPTGRAAKRMTEATGREAKTVHRLLEYGYGEEDEETYGRNEDNPLEQQVVIVDEMSMVDTFLMMRLLRAIRAGSRLVLIGDSDQLPSVGPGNVLRDIIGCGAIPVVRLDKVYRQGAGSAISLNAQRINRAQPPEHVPGEFDLVFCRDAREIWDNLQQIVQQQGQVQVITPMRKGELGVLGLNERLQALCNPPHPSRRELPATWKHLREGDKVMQIRNDYRMEWRRDEGVRLEKGVGVFNGEMGFVQEIDKDKLEVAVEFDDGRTARYGFAQTDALDLAYATSIHKSQGSEFDQVAIVLAGGPPMLYTRNLLYTAVTRAKKRVWIVGRRQALQQMVQNNRIKARYSGLSGALSTLFAR